MIKDRDYYLNEEKKKEIFEDESWKGKYAILLYVYVYESEIVKSITNEYIRKLGCNVYGMHDIYETYDEAKEGLLILLKKEMIYLTKSISLLELSKDCD